MIAQETIRQLTNISVTERLYLIQILLDSLKQDIKDTDIDNNSPPKEFAIRTFNLGQDIDVDRDILYAERGF